MALTTKKKAGTRLLRFVRNKQYEGKLYGPDYCTDAVLVTERWARQFLQGGSAVEVDASAEPAETHELPYASAAARKLAEKSGLVAYDFEGFEASSSEGYTKSDVQAVVDARSSEG